MVDRWDNHMSHKEQFKLVNAHQWCPTESDVADGLDSVFEGIRVALVRRTDYTLTEMLVSKIMQNSDPVISALMCRSDWTPSRDNVLLGLSSSNHMIRRSWILRMDWTPDEGLVDAVLQDFNHNNRLEWLKRADWTPLNRHVDTLLADTRLAVTINLLSRMDWTPTSEQILAGINHDNSDVSDAWKNRLRFQSQSIIEDSDSITTYDVL